MKNKDVNEIYTLFEEIREIVKAGNSNSAPTQPEILGLSAIDELSGKLDEAIREIRKPVRTEYHHIFSIASSKVFYGMIGLCIMCLILFFIVFYQQKEITTCKDNDLKYRYVQMQGEITPAGVNYLDSIFENRRDSVRMIRKLVKQHEKAVIEKTRRLERARLKELEAEQLRQDVENFKHKK